MQKDDSEGKVFNVCGDIPRKMQFFTDCLIEISGLHIHKQVCDRLFRKIDIYYQHGDTTALRELTGWKPEIDITNTLKELLNYWLEKI